jgi:hypothetical protein
VGMILAGQWVDFVLMRRTEQTGSIHGSRFQRTG